METEIPVCVRCCCCFPLRYGLIAFGYFKLVITALLMTCLVITMYNLVHMLIYFRGITLTSEIIIVCVILTIVLVDFILHAIFVAGAHKKQTNLLRIYYFYSLGLWILSALLSIIGTIILMTTFMKHCTVFMLFMSLSDLAALFIYHFLQIYIILLVRSQIVKLKNSSKFRFVNLAAEAENALKIEVTDNGNVQEENGIEDNIDISTCANGDCGSRVCCKVEIDET